jgi:SWI/SNF-related matrix-associated actin-dependent regulator of chromatin subfamily A-like protein 1
VILDYNPNTKAFIIRVNRSDDVEVQTLIREHGLDFSTSASTPGEAVLFTREPYAAAAFGSCATPQARGQLHGILTEIDASWRAESKAHIRCPADKELWPFQKADIEYALRRKNTLIGDQPGLGKTPIGICFANETRAKRVLVLCPASIRLQWMKRIQEWTTMEWGYYIHVIVNSSRGVHPNAAWTVCSYELARNESIAAALLKGTYDLLILDEAHYLKTPSAARTRAVFGGGEVENPLADRCGAILALTGTPLPNRPREAFTLARGLCPDAIDWMSEDHFKDRFNPSFKGEILDRNTGRMKVFIDERTGRHSELQNRLRANFMTRHLKRDVMTQLKMPVYDIIQLEETGAVKQALEAESLLDLDPETLAGADFSAMGQISVVRKMMGVALAPQVADYVKMLLDGGEEKIVLFCWHIEVGNILENALKEYGVVRFVAGQTKANDRKKDEFINNPAIQVILGNVLTLGTGTDGLQLVSNHALIAEPSWTPGENIQCFDRLDRGGQTRTVQGEIFVAPNSFAERVLATALRKNQTTHKALDRRIE